MSLKPREEYTQIRVDVNGDWHTGEDSSATETTGSIVDTKNSKSRKIINQEVLNYFKTNLQLDEKGIYIFNKFGDFSEKGYIIVHGPVFAVRSIDKTGFFLDTGEIIPFTDICIVMQQDKIYLKIKRLQAWAQFTRNAMVQLMDSLEERNNIYYFQGTKIEVVDNLFSRSTITI